MIFEQEWKGRNCREGDYFPVSVPGNIQYDFAIAKGFKDLSYSDNYKQFIPYENDIYSDFLYTCECFIKEHFGKHLIYYVQKSYQRADQ